MTEHPNITKVNLPLWYLERPKSDYPNQGYPHDLRIERVHDMRILVLFTDSGSACRYMLLSGLITGHNAVEFKKNWSVCDTLLHLKEAGLATHVAVNPERLSAIESVEQYDIGTVFNVFERRWKEECRDQA